jgi:hypothetical protein
MKKTLLFVFGLLIFVGMAYAQEAPTITIANNTGCSIRYIYIASTTSDSWGDNVLGRFLDDGYKRAIALPPSDGNRYNIQVVDEEGTYYTKGNVAVRANGEVTFTARDIDDDV